MNVILTIMTALLIIFTTSSICRNQLVIAVGLETVEVTMILSCARSWSWCAGGMTGRALVHFARPVGAGSLALKAQVLLDTVLFHRSLSLDLWGPASSDCVLQRV